MMNDNISHKTLLIILCILLFSLSLSPGCLEEDAERTYEYKIQISEYEGSENYTLYLPFPVDSEGHNEDILDALKKQEKGANFEIVNESKGICLKLAYDDNLTINLEGELDKFDYELSMYNYTYHNGEENYWVHSNFNETLHLKIYYERNSSMGSGSLKKYTAEGNIKEGWQLVDAETENVEG